MKKHQYFRNYPFHGCVYTYMNTFRRTYIYYTATLKRLFHTVPRLRYGIEHSERAKMVKHKYPTWSILS